MQAFHLPWVEPMVTELLVEGTARTITREKIMVELMAMLRDNEVPNPEEFVVHGEPKIRETSLTTRMTYDHRYRQNTCGFSVVTVRISRER